MGRPRLKLPARRGLWRIFHNETRIKNNRVHYKCQCACGFIKWICASDIMRNSHGCLSCVPRRKRSAEYVQKHIVEPHLAGKTFDEIGLELKRTRSRIQQLYKAHCNGTKQPKRKKMFYRRKLIKLANRFQITPNKLAKLLKKWNMKIPLTDAQKGIIERRLHPKLCEICKTPIEHRGRLCSNEQCQRDRARTLLKTLTNRTVFIKGRLPNFVKTLTLPQPDTFISIAMARRLTNFSLMQIKYLTQRNLIATSKGHGLRKCPYETTLIARNQILDIATKFTNREQITVYVPTDNTTDLSHDHCFDNARNTSLLL